MNSQDTGRRLLTTIRILRKHHKCTLPIEVWGFPDELANLGAVRSEIDTLAGEVSWRTVEIEKRQGKWKQFHIKGEVLARSSFSELLYLDSDSIPLTDPAFLFDSATFKQNGAVFWADFNRDPPANPIWRMIGNLHCSPARAWQVETGQVLIDKRARGGLNLVALEIARAMQDDEEFWFRLSGGDKDTFVSGASLRQQCLRPVADRRIHSVTPSTFFPFPTRWPLTILPHSVRLLRPASKDIASAVTRCCITASNPGWSGRVFVRSRSGPTPRSSSLRKSSMRRRS